ncbi:hypothetical protein QR680_004645 [Steinernema hermaphroditum]|uniref:Uncharacterized protein n=1 Tax=Steinernema hermaphroditum TaxID=289476 RepID=A0AA39HPC6_9BILA|nr:hypothetical protein QR680_004645 [Steinernema hermaphroditum]
MSVWFAFFIIPAIVLVIFVFFLAARAASNRAQSTSPVYVTRERNQTCVSAGTGVIHNTVPVYMVNPEEPGQERSTNPHATSVQLHAVNEAQSSKPDEPPPAYNEIVRERSDEHVSVDVEKNECSSETVANKANEPQM